MTARVYVDQRCDGFFVNGVDFPLDGVNVMLSFPNGATVTRQTRPFGLVSFAGFDASGGVTVSVELPESYKGYALDSCPGSPASVDLAPEDFQFGFKFVQFRARVLREEVSP